MAQPEKSWNDRQSYGPVDNSLQFPGCNFAQTYTTPDIKTTKSRLLKGLVITLAIILPACLGLHLLLLNHPEYMQELQTHSSWDRLLLSPKHDTDEHIGCHRHHETHRSHDDLAWTTNNVTLARRENKKYTFQIPITAKKYLFGSWGWIDKSTIKVVPFESDQKLIQVDVEVVKNPKNTAKVFKLPLRGNEINGVGFYSRWLSNYRDQPAFDVTVRIPVSGEQQQQLNSFETRLTNFDHELKDLAKPFMFSQLYTSTTNGKMIFDKVLAKELSISSTNGALKLDSVVSSNMLARTTNGAIKLNQVMATKASIRSTNGGVTGKAWSNKELSVATTNGRIEGEYTLTKSGTIKLSTTNGKISGQVRLKSKEANGATDGSARSSYRVMASTTNSPISLKVLEQPVGSGCFVSASTTSSAKVEMPPAFEGRFRFNTGRNQGKVEVKGKTDPAGRGRERVVQYDRPRSTASGWTGWGSVGDNEQHAPGEVRIGARGSAQLILN